MTLEEKIESSTIVRSYTSNSRKMGIQDTNQRIKSFIMYLLVVGFTIYTKIILKASFDLSIAFIILNLITMIILKFISKSVFCLNHNHIYRFVVFLNKVCKVIIFLYAMYDYYAYFNAYFKENYNSEVMEYLYYNIIKGDVYIKDVLNSQYMTLKFISFIFSIILFIPTFFYTIIILFKYCGLVYLYNICLPIMLIPIFNIFVLILYLITNNNRFKYYRYSENKDFVIIETREINSKFYIFQKVLLKLLICIPGIIVIVLAYIFIYNKLIVPMM